MNHDTFSPSSWDCKLHCPGAHQAIKEWGLPDESNPASRLGTAVHEVVHACFRDRLPTADSWLGKKVLVEGHSIPIGPDEVRGANLMLDTCYQLEQQVGGTIFPEVRVDGARMVGPHARGLIRGTADVLIKAGRLRIIVDYKNGRIPKDVKRILQLRGYSLGAVDDGVEEIWEYIVQPNAHHADGPVRHTHYSMEVLRDFAKWVSNQLHLALTDDAPRIPGEIQCEWCLAKSKCPEHTDLLFKGIPVTTKPGSRVPLPKSVDHLSLENLETVVRHERLFLDWIEECKRALLQQELKNPRSTHGFKAVPAVTRRRYKDSKDVLDLLTWEDFDLDIVAPRELISPKQLLEKVDGERPDLTEEVREHIEKPKGTPVLAPRSDPRPDCKPTAETMFGGIKR